MQRTERDTLSQAELEAMAAERGISAHHVRQAITLSGQQRTSRQKRLIAIVIVVYSLAVGVNVITANHLDIEVATPVCCVGVCTLPFALAWLGTQMHRKRTGAAAGAIVIVGMSVIMLFAGLINGVLFASRGTNTFNIQPADLLYIGIFTCFGAAAGFSGAASNQWLARRRARYQHITLKPSDLDQ